MIMHDLIIIGGGPAGITAGIYAARKNLDTLIITKDFMGQTGKASVVENWPGIEKISGPELMFKFKEHLESFKIKTIEGETTVVLEKNKDSFSVTTDKKNTFESKSVIITTGRNPRPLKVPGEEKYVGKGISYCAVCDAPMFSGKSVAIIGGGNSGFETAIEMAGRKSPKVYILEIGSKIMADEVLRNKVSGFDNIEVLTQAMLKEVRGGDFVKSITYLDRESKEEKELEVEGVFVEIGSIPVVDFVKGLAECNEKGEVIVNHKDCSTKTPGLFAAGDVTDVPYKQIIIAAGEGSKAALGAYSYLTDRNK